MKGDKRQRWAAAFFLLLASCIGIWWMLLWTVPRSRVWFVPPGGEWALMAFLPADAIVVGASLLAALAPRGSRRSRSAAWFASGGVSFGALWCVASWWLQGGPFWSTMLMVPAAVLSVCGALLLAGERGE